MNCEQYQCLTPKERIEFIGKLIHAVQSDGISFGLGEKLIRGAERRGAFEGVVINPPTIQENDPIEI